MSDYLDFPPSTFSYAERAYIQSILLKAISEAEKARAKFPQPNYVTLKVAEEAGEVVKEAVHYAEGRGDWGRVEAEIVQTIAMLMRLLTDGDQVIGLTPERLSTCKKCGGTMKLSKAIRQTYTGGMKDFESDAGPSTFSAGGPGELVECLKCENCGWSVNNG